MVDRRNDREDRMDQDREQRNRGDARRRTSSRVEREEPDRDEDREQRGSRRRSRRGGDLRDQQDRALGLVSEILELQQGLLYAGIEAASSSLDTATRVTRNSVDRAFSRDLRDPGDIVRNIGRDAQETVRDVLEGARETPRRMNDGFYEAVRPSSRRGDRGERWRRSQARHEED